MLRALVAVAVLLALLGWGCAAPGSGGPGTPPPVDRLTLLAPEDAREADEPPAFVPRTGPPSGPARTRAPDPQAAGDVPATEVPVLPEVEDPEALDAASPPARTYEGQLPQILSYIDEYWSEALGDRYLRPSVYPAYEQNGPSTCGPRPLPPQNAVYCPNGHFVSWDETGLMRPFYERGGDMGVAFVLAHEWGHAAQALLGVDFPRTIFAELQADCLAGAWARWIDRQGLLEEGDVAEALRAIYVVADPEAIPWTAPGAHGDFQQRAAFFGYGRENGAQACLDVMAPFES